MHGLPGGYPGCGTEDCRARHPHPAGVFPGDLCTDRCPGVPQTGDAPESRVVQGPGAGNKILANIAAARTRGVVAASAGNHAQGVAVAAHAAGVQATIVMPSWASLAKQEATRRYGAEVVIYGSSLRREYRAGRGVAQEGWLFIHPYDDDDVIAGQGTIGLEILHDLPVQI